MVKSDPHVIETPKPIAKNCHGRLDPVGDRLCHDATMVQIHPWVFWEKYAYF